MKQTIREAARFERQNATHDGDRARPVERLRDAQHHAAQDQRLDRRREPGAHARHGPDHQRARIHPAHAVAIHEHARQHLGKGERILEGRSTGAFGYIAAELDLAEMNAEN